MAKTINLIDTLCSDNDEACIIDNLSLGSKDVNTWIKSKTSIRDTEINIKALEFIKKMSEIKNTKNAIQNVKYSKDNILCRIIELAEPPFYIKKELMNYKALVLYFMRDFRDSVSLSYEDFSSTSKIDLSNLENEIFEEGDKIKIKTQIESLLHLINVDKKKIKAKDIYEKIMYDTVEFGEYIKNEKFFHSKVASVGWIKDTLMKPDLIYSGSSVISKKLKFDVCFIRETGNGKKSQKYMYHLVGLSKIYNNLYTIVSQFPLEKDRTYSSGDQYVSRLHEFVQCNKPLYVREGIEIPLYSTELNSDDSALVNKLKNGFGSNIY